VEGGWKVEGGRSVGEEDLHVDTKEVGEECVGDVEGYTTEEDSQY